MVTQHPNNNSIQFNSIQFFIIYVPSQHLQGQLQTQHSVDTSNNNNNNNNNNNKYQQYKCIYCLIKNLN
jgi:hypothetical protein